MTKHNPTDTLYTQSLLKHLITVFVAALASWGHLPMMATTVVKTDLFFSLCRQIDVLRLH